jgi:hypothetical protein
MSSSIINFKTYNVVTLAASMATSKPIEEQGMDGTRLSARDFGVVC